MSTKKGLYLSLLVLLFSLGNALQAYRFKIQNKTSYKLNFGIEYWGCGSDYGSIEPKKTKLIATGGCLAQRIALFTHIKGYLKGVDHIVRAADRRTIFAIPTFIVEVENPDAAPKKIRLRIRKK